MSSYVRKRNVATGLERFLNLNAITQAASRVHRGPEQHRQHAIPAPQVRDRYRCHREWMTRPPAVMSS
jgi:hypothetical protein